MENVFISTFAVLPVMLLVLAANARQVHVNGYYRKDGTYVSPHVRNVGGGVGSYYSSSHSSGRSSSIKSFSNMRTRTEPETSPSIPSSENLSLRLGERLQRMDNDAQYDEIMRSLKPCQAFRDDGTPCQKKALPGNKYCSLHVGYIPLETKPLDSETIKRNVKLRSETLGIIDSLSAAIQKYKAKNGGVLPKSLADVSSVTNDAWGGNLYYEIEGNDFAIASDGGDGRAGTADDIEYISNRILLCQAVLPDGRICQKVAKTGTWYCSAHTKQSRPVSVAESTAETTGDVDEAGGVDWRLSMDLVLLLLGVGAICIAIQRRRQDDDGNSLKGG